jgi:hypothetical protein
MAKGGSKRRTIDFSDCDLKHIHAIMTLYSRVTEADAIRWAVRTVAMATEIVITSTTGEIVRISREG